MEKLKLYVISHTHWDREWYQPFQKYRYRLVRIMDDLITNLEKDEEYKTFYLDGQTIVLEDYLEVRPEMEERLKKLIQAGRIHIGPWYVMPDEFLIAGESLIKNLRMGHKICENWGVRPMKNGYVTDIFGHNSQFPQILNGFDIRAATLYRGIGDYEKDAFRWRSPDGSEVLAAKLESARSYSNFYFAVRWPYEETGFDEKDAVKRMQILVDRARQMAASDMVLMMDGVDHSGMEPDIPKMIRLFQREIPDVELIHGGLEEYFERLDKKALEIIEGPLYHVAWRGGNNQVIKNVLSSMVHLKQANDHCETYLSAISEPLNALCEGLSPRLKSFRGDDYSLSPRRNYLDLGWKYLIQNHPHDSICGCSLSDVHRDNVFRYRQTRQIAEASADDCATVLTRNIRTTGDHHQAVMLYNPSQREVNGVRIVTLPLAKTNACPNYRFYDSQNRLLDVQILSETDDLYPKNRLRQLIQLTPGSQVTVAMPLQIPAMGYTVICCDDLQSEYHIERKAYAMDPFYPPRRLQGGQMTAHNRIDNGKLTVELNCRGLLDVTVNQSGHTFRNLHLLEDRSDVGDGWNWGTTRYDNAIFGENCLEQFGVLSDGPLCTVWKLDYALHLPKKASPDFKTRSAEEHIQRVTTLLMVPKDSEQLFFETSLTNQTENHRLRVLFPSFSEADTFRTKTPFDFCEWEVAHEDNTDCVELETKVHPSQGVTRIGEANPLSLYSKGLYEVEVTDNEEKALALTLFRAAQNECGTAHPQDIKMLRDLNFSYALSFADQSVTQTMLEGEAYRAGLYTFAFDQNPLAENDPDGAFLTVSPCEKILSHLSEDHGKYTLRFYDVSGKEETLSVTLPRAVASANYCNLLGQPMGACEVQGSSFSIHCPPHKIVTVEFTLE